MSPMLFLALVIVVAACILLLVSLALTRINWRELDTKRTEDVQ